MSVYLGVALWPGSSFEMDFKAFLASLAALALCYFLWKWKKQFAAPHLYFSDIKTLGNSLSGKWANLPETLSYFSLLLLILAFPDPRLLIERHRENKNDESVKSPTEGIAIYLVLDQSGSMAEEISSITRQKKVDLLKQVTKQFIAGDPNTGLQGRPNDLIGLIEFARGAHVLSPLTLDHAAILSELATFAPIGERDQDGTSIGYAIFKSANMISATKHYAQELIDKGDPAYTIKSTIMILITDGMQDPNPLDKGKRLRNMDIPEAAAYTKEQGIRLYIVNIEPKMAFEEFAPNRHIMQRAAELTGGKFYMADGSTNLEGIYRDIDKLEKSALPEGVQNLNKDQRPDLYRRFPFSPFLVGMGLILLLASLLLDSTLFRRVP